MPETDVEKTLREIRERVRVQLRHQGPASVTPAPESSQNSLNGPAIESIRANLSVVERARTRLPPITSYRSGTIAKLELWIKRLLRRASHWFTWEQVNFNSATSNTLKEVLVVVSSHEQVLMELQTQLQEIICATTRMQTDLESHANGYPSGNSLHEYRATGTASAAAVAAGDNRSAREQQLTIDSEMKLLAQRLEELRAIKQRLDNLT